MNEAQRLANDQAEAHGPEVGMGITIQVGSDAYAGTIIEVSPTGKTFKFQKDEMRATKNHNAYSESEQSYIYIPNPKAEIEVARKSRKDGLYYSKHIARRRIYLGVRDGYMNPSF